ncbi:hypothetical protein EYF80_025088 [Liparis tanakae]|uniref:Uncharacterized protein n=1 Tax=Liparis tanakae TaxID=230148 RepID=A0A4Z2HGF0_9TELE|nr:hypothetical protein EYF80_025088 [Liparis tanakae]
MTKGKRKRNVALHDLVHDLSVGALVRVGGCDLGYHRAHCAVFLHENLKVISGENRGIVVDIQDCHLDVDGGSLRGNASVNGIGRQLIERHALTVQAAYSSDNARRRFNGKVSISVLAILEGVLNAAVGVCVPCYSSRASVDAELWDIVLEEVRDSSILPDVVVCGTDHNDGASRRSILIHANRVVGALENRPMSVGIRDVDVHLTGVVERAV